MIELKCPCGKKVRVDESAAGQTLVCMRCGRELTPPAPKPPPPPPSEEGLAPDLMPLPADAAPPASTTSYRDFLYWLLPLFFLPLAVMLGKHDPESLKDRILKDVPQDQRQKVKDLMEREGASLDQVLFYLPNRRLSGSLLPRNTMLHWAFAAVATVVFTCLIASCLAPGVTEPRYLFYVGMITGTLGVCVTLTSYHLPFIGMMLRIMLYEADVQKDFLPVLGGMTLGVGLVEELCKLLPLLWYLRRYRKISWHWALLWGLASGAGFGISEGVVYSVRQYNGVTDGLVYLVRFASCVALHAIWTASAGLTLVRSQDLFLEFFRMSSQEQMFKVVTQAEQAEQSQNEAIQNLLVVFAAIRTVVVVMFLHGLYNTAASLELNGLALAAAVISFGWLAWQIETFRAEEQPAEAPAPEPI